MDFYTFWKSLNSNERANFAKKAGMSEGYISTQLIYKYKTPSIHTLKKMAEASNGLITYHNLCDFFIDK